MTLDNLPGEQDRVRESIQESFYLPGEELASDEMRITFMGTSYISRVGQACNSVFIECGNGESFVFDCGSGVCAKYVALGVPWSRMTRVFLTHLHADHMSDLAFIYCFGPSGDRKTALHVYGPSGPVIPEPYPKGDEPYLDEQEHPEEGTENFCDLMKQMCKWHTESFSFLQTGITGSNGEEVDDGYNLIPHELDYHENAGVAYTSDDGKVKIWHFPAAHDRDGAISYRLEFNDMKVVFSGDTVPTRFMLENAGDGVDVLIHEMQLDPATMAMKETGSQPGDIAYELAFKWAIKIVGYSHTTPKMLGKILNETKPQLGVITHFPINQDTLIPALDELRSEYKDGPIALATDAMVLNLTPKKNDVGKVEVGKVDIRQRMALFSDYAWNTNVKFYKNVADAKYEGPQWSEFISESVLYPLPDKDKG